MLKAVLIYSLCFMHNAKAQQYTFLNFTTEEGLAQSQVTGMCQDQKGYLWFSTYGGVSRYDGKSFKNFGINNGLFNNQVLCMDIDERGMLWFGCMGGYSKYDGKKFLSSAFSGKFSQSNTTSIASDGKGRVWFSFEDAGVGYLKNEKFIPVDTNAIGTDVRNIHVDQTGRVLASSGNGVFVFNEAKQKFEQLSIPQLKNISPSYIVSDQQNNLYIATYGEGLYTIKNNVITHLTPDDGLIDFYIRSLYFDSKGSLWASSISGASQISEGRIQNYTDENGLVNNNIKFVGEDNEGNIWLGTDGKGLLKFTGEAFVAYTKKDGFSSDLIMTIIQDKKGEYWFGTYGNGVIHFNGKNYTFHTETNGLSNNVVWTSCIDKEGRVYFGTSNGLCVYENGKMINKFYESEGLLSNKVTSLLASPDGTIWIGNKNGLNSYKNGIFKGYGRSEGLHGGNIRSIFRDENGVLWLGGSAGLFRFDGKKFILYKPNPAMDDNTVYSVTSDQTHPDELWVGTNAGLFKFSNGKFNKIFLSDNPNSNNVNFILPDEKNIWVGTNNGIFELHKNRQTDSMDVKFYSRLEGVRGQETNLNAAYIDRYGYRWFGTDAGLIRYDKKRTKTKEKHTPFIHIDQVKIFFEEPNWKRISRGIDKISGLPTNVRVKHNQNHFTFYFTGISHSNPEKVKYVFKLEGFDDEWSPPTDIPITTYSNLPHGYYTFKVRAINGEGIWSDEIAQFSFEIIAPFWRTWWFYTFCILFVLAVIFGIWRWRVAVIERKNRTMQLYYKSKLLALEQQSLNASMNRHFIFNSLNSIQYYINKQDKLEANRYLTNFAKLIRKNLDSSVNGENLVTLNEELDRIKLYLSLETMRFKDRFEYEIKMSNEVNGESIYIPPMLLQPYVENSIWHGILPKEGEGKILIKVEMAQDKPQTVIITLTDDGIGIKTSLENKVKTTSTHISRGIEITSGRLNVLKKMTNQNLEIQGPEEIYHADGSVAGTRVILTMSQIQDNNTEKKSLKLFEN